MAREDQTRRQAARRLPALSGRGADDPGGGQVPMPETVNGIEQKPLAGKSFLASFTDPDFKGRNSAVLRDLQQPFDL